MASILIRQFDVFANPSGQTAQSFPFLVVLQADWVRETSSVIVAPLVRPNPALRHPLLYPEFRIEARRLVLAISDLAALPRTRLTKRVANLDAERHRIIAALDLLFTGS
jgi:toxin CcdB